MSQKPPVDPSTLPTAEPVRPSPFIRSSRTPEEREAARQERQARSAAEREERVRRRREEEEEARRAGVPVPPRRTFIQARDEVDVAADVLALEEAIADVEASLDAFIWRPRRDFPAFLRKIREDAKVSLRQAAPALGMSAAYLSRLETGGPARQPSLDRLNRMADLYNVDRHAMYEAAGVQVEVPENELLDWTDDEFEALMLDPALAPGMMTHEALNYFSPRMKRQILELVQNLVSQLDPAEYLAFVLKKAREIE